MKKERQGNGVPVEAGTGNVYADLRYARSEEMLIKAQLVSKLAEIIKKRGLIKRASGPNQTPASDE